MNWRRLLPSFLRATTAPAVLPMRIAAVVDRQQQRSEILIAVVQFIIVVTLIALYALAPKPQDGEMMNSVTFRIITAYAAFSVLRLVLCLRGFMPNWFLGLAVVADVALLMLLIWGFHIEYGQPPGFYLKAPTMLYVFIFIALRTLRFDVGFLLLTGLSAVVGWLLLVLLAVTGEGGSETITRSFVEYATSTKVLIGAEFDKVISVLVTTAILALGIVRARRLLVEAATAGAAARDLGRFFTPEVAEAITGAASEIRPGQGVLRAAAILHVDIRGFSALAATMQPNDVMALLAEYQRHMVPVIRRHGGDVDKYLGDGILASFGTSRISGRHAATALQAMCDLREAAAAWGAERTAAGLAVVEVAVAVAAGTVVFGAVGDAERLEYTVIGEPVNLCARLEKHCKAEACFGLVDQAAYDLALAQGFLPPADMAIRPARPVAGLSGPIDLVILPKRGGVA